MSEPKKDKKFMAVRGDLLSKVIEISNKRGKSVYGFVNEIFEQAIRAEEMDTTLTDIVEFTSLIETMKKAGAVITTNDILDHSIKRLYRLEKKSLMEKWYVSGVWYGKYLSAKFKDPVDVFQKILTTCFWEVTEADISTVEDNNLSMRIVAPSHSKENTELLLKFIVGLMNALNYRTVKEEFWKGIIMLKLEKRAPIPDIELGLESM